MRSIKELFKEIERFNREYKYKGYSIDEDETYGTITINFEGKDKKSFKLRRR